MAGKRFLLGFIGGLARALFSWPGVQPAQASCGVVSYFLVFGSQRHVPQANLLTFNAIYNDTPMRLLRGTNGVLSTHGRRTVPVLMNRANQVANQYGVYGLSASVFVDKKDVVQGYVNGGPPTEQRIIEAASHIQKQEAVRAASAC